MVLPTPRVGEAKMAISTGTQNEWSSSGTASASTSSRDTEDGLLPVIKFLQNALAMKARVRSKVGGMA